MRLLHSGRSSRRRNLAVAFLREIRALMDAVEGHEEVRRLEETAKGAVRNISDLQFFMLPKFLVYENSAGHISIFDPYIQRDITLFYARLDSLMDHLHVLYVLSSSSATPLEICEQHAKNALKEIGGTIALGEQLLRGLRKFISSR